MSKKITKIIPRLVQISAVSDSLVYALDDEGRVWQWTGFTENWLMLQDPPEQTLLINQKESKEG